MSRIICREADCESRVLDGAIYCGEHIGQKRRCKATKPGTDGKVRCKKPALAGLDVCERHGGRFPNPQAVHERSKALTKMQRFVKPYEGELDPLGALETEFRRTLGRIMWLEAEISELDPEDLIWGKTEHITATGADGYPSTKYEARPHLYEEMLWKERRHLLDMEKLWIAAGIEKERLRVMERQVSWTYNKVVDAIRALGLDPFTQENRAILAGIFDAQPPAIEAR